MILLQQAIGSILRWLLAIGAGYLVSKGIWTQSDANSYVGALAAAATMGLISLVWSFWQKYSSHITLLTALQSPPGTTVEQVQNKVANGMGAKLGAVLLAVALGAGMVTSTSCASLGGARHTATVSVVSAHAVLSAIQDGEMSLVCGKPTAPAPPTCVPQATHQQISAKLVTAFDYDGKLATIVRALPANTSSPDTATLVGEISALVDAILKLIPESSGKQALVAKVGAQ